MSRLLVWIMQKLGYQVATYRGEVLGFAKNKRDIDDMTYSKMRDVSHSLWKMPEPDIKAVLVESMRPANDKTKWPSRIRLMLAARQ